MIEKIFLFLKNYKGAIASLLGFLMAFPVNINLVFKYYTIGELSRAQLTTALIVNSIAMVWFILPSRITFKSKIFGEFILED